MAEKPKDSRKVTGGTREGTERERQASAVGTEESRPKAEGLLEEVLRRENLMEALERVRWCGRLGAVRPPAYPIIMVLDGDLNASPPPPNKRISETYWSASGRGAGRMGVGVAAGASTVKSRLRHPTHGGNALPGVPHKEQLEGHHRNN
jgi:hypothetical protein